MRTLIALSCCVLTVAFGFVAGAAHVHRAADHHDDMRGLHLDHAHIGHGTDHGHERHARHSHTSPGESVGTIHLEHHDRDVLHFDVTARRLSDPGLRVMPATVAAAAKVDPPSSVSIRRAVPPEPLRGPPGEGEVPARAPPA